MLSLGEDNRKYEQFLQEFWAKLRTGDFIRVKGTDVRSPHPFEGHIVQKYPTFVVVQGKNYRECYHRDGFYCGNNFLTRGKQD